MDVGISLAEQMILQSEATVDNLWFLEVKINKQQCSGLESETHGRNFKMFKDNHSIKSTILVRDSSLAVTWIHEMTKITIILKALKFLFTIFVKKKLSAEKSARWKIVYSLLVHQVHLIRVWDAYNKMGMLRKPL